jgi:hypothetical protein
MSENIPLKNRLYAHVFFDSSELNIAVYKLGKIPGFSRDIVDPELQEHIGSKAFDAFAKILEGKISAKQMQQGGIIDYENIKEDLPVIERLARNITQDSSLKVIVDLDQTKIWWEFFLSELSRDVDREAEEKLNIEEKKKKALEYKNYVLKRIQEETKNKEQFFRKLYTFISFKYYPKHGPKDYSRSTKDQSPPIPPTFLVSKGNPSSGLPGFVFFPGYRGAHYLTQTPKAPEEGKKSLFFTAPGETTSEDASPAHGKPIQTWYTKLIPNVKKYTKDQLPLSFFNHAELIFTTEEVAHSFYEGLSDSSTASWAAFNKATPKAKEKAVELIGKLEPTSDKAASNEIGVWIDLQTGKIFNSEESLISSMKNEEQTYSEGFAIAAKSKFKISKIAGSLLLKGNRKLFKKLIKIIS